MDDLRTVVAFLNTVDVEAGEDDLADPDAAARWFAEHDLLPGGASIDAPGLDRACALRTALRELARVHHDAQPDPAAAAAFGEATRGLSLGTTADPAGDVHLRPAGQGLDAALGGILAAVAHASAVGTWSRVKLCSADACLWAFVDASKNRSRRWCAMGVCGNREKARSYRERHRAS